MKIERSWLEDLIFGGEAPRRFTQDSPILPDVWLAYLDPEDESNDSSDKRDLLFTPYRNQHPGEVVRRILEVLTTANGGDRKADTEIASNQAVVAAKLRFRELVFVALALSDWWKQHALKTLTPEERRAEARKQRRGADPVRSQKTVTPDELRTREMKRVLARELEELSWRQLTRERKVRPPGHRASAPLTTLTFTPGFLWFIRVAGVVELMLRRRGEEPAGSRNRGEARSDLEVFAEIAWSFPALVEAFVDMLPPAVQKDSAMHVVSVNRRAFLTVDRSVPTIKADAAVRLFSIQCDRICWAIVDSGVDATHPAFRCRDARGRPKTPANGETVAGISRVVRTFDFTRIRTLLNPSGSDSAYLRRLRANVALGERLKPSDRRGRAVVDNLDPENAAKKLRESLNDGRMLDWQLIWPLLEVPHDARYPQPTHDHGTHVAGILAGDWRRQDFADDDPFHPGDADLCGVCPDLQLYDFRIFSDDAKSDEFSIMGVLQFIRWLNERGDQPVIHGVNLSLSIHHEVTNFACGRTPVCEESTRLVQSGVVVVAAAGNEGRAEYALAGGGTSQGYRSISISDPGNAEEVITVGSTHRHEPHSYGVSYFSSRGPTGDGRLKPDLVAPGEKITAAVPNGSGTKDGTSMAAPHVSGAAALLLARHRELLGDPLRVKTVLCKTATDLGRERYFQGAGLVDVLRAIQSV